MASPPEFRYHYIRSDTSDLQGLATQLRSIAPPGVTEIIPSYENIMVEYDPDRVSLSELQELIVRARETALSPEENTGRVVRVPVRYDGEDLPALSAQLNLSIETIVRLHSEREYRVFALGFTPGFPFLGDIDKRLRLPRRGVPRPQVPANTVAIAGFQTGIYPSATPGGWHLLGQALTAVYDPHRADPFLIHPGDRVRFVPAQGEAPAAPIPLPLLPSNPDYPVLRVDKPGLRDIMVDRGRFGLAHFGLARSGPLDSVTAGIANRLVGNSPGATVLEMHVQGPKFTALSDTVLATAGGGYIVKVNSQAVPACSSFAVSSGDEVAIEFVGGQLAYLSVAGSFQSDEFAGSTSVDVNGLIGQSLQGGEVLGAAERRRVRPGRVFTPHCWRPRTIHVPILPGPQCSAEAIRRMIEASFIVESGNRMGILLGGNIIPGSQISSEGNPIGSVQTTTDGRLIILLQDRGTIGGYHKPAIVDPRFIWRVATASPGQMIQFHADSRAFLRLYSK